VSTRPLFGGEWPGDEATLETTTSTKMFGNLPSVNCYLARENLVISMIHSPWLLLRQVLKLKLLAMYNVPRYRMLYLWFAARFPICSFSGVKCWYGDHTDVTVVNSHVTTAYNFAETTFTSWLQTAKFAKVFSLESFPLYSRYTYTCTLVTVPNPYVSSLLSTL